MAKLEMDFPDDLLGGLLSVNTEEMCKQMVDEATPIMVESMKKEMQNVIGHEGDSELVNSVKSTKAKVTKNDAILSFVGPKGKSSHYYYQNGKKQRKYVVTNALKAIWLNYGRNGQTAKPFLVKATNNASEQVKAKMQQVYDRITGGKSG
ncbi:MAG: hypothetical protein PHP50_11055 [Lachnospiraceae bacterium]|nr:hypothetical protein [Lachnospiraceae bacterium]